MMEASLRMPPLAREAMSEAQRAAADELIAGPRKGVKGPFIALLRSPELMGRLQRVGEYLRFNSAVPPRLSEFATLVVSRAWTQQFEWFMHVPLALKAGTSQRTLDELASGRRPTEMSDEEAAVYDFTTELITHYGVSAGTYREAVTRFGEQGVVDLVAIVGYFTLMSMELNVAQTPAEEVPEIQRLKPLP
jgi:4-carboxymuconolactone decarboxylase